MGQALRPCDFFHIVLILSQIDAAKRTRIRVRLIEFAARSVDTGGHMAPIAMRRAYPIDANVVLAACPFFRSYM